MANQIPDMNPDLDNLLAETATSLESLSADQPNPTLQSKDIVITYILMILNQFSSNVRKLKTREKIHDPEADVQTKPENKSALKILSSLFTVSPRDSLSSLGLSLSSIKSYKKWGRGVIESAVWFNSLTAEDIECLHDVQTEGVQLETLLKVLRLAVQKIPSSNGHQHNAIVIVISNLLTSTFSYQDAFSLHGSGGSSSRRSKEGKSLKYDSRLRNMIRELTSVLLVDETLDMGEQEKTRSFVQQRIEHSVVSYMMAQKIKENEYSVGFNTKSLLQLNAEIKSFILTSNKRRKSGGSNLLDSSKSDHGPMVSTHLSGSRRGSTRATRTETSTPSTTTETSPTSPGFPDLFTTYPTPPGLLDTWGYALVAAQLAGEQLGKRILVREGYGNRPVSLTGFGLGARVVYFAVLEVVRLAEMGDSNAFSLIDSVYLVTAPVVLDLETWPKIASVVSGRLVNAYSTNDTTLTLFQTSLDTDSSAARVQYIGACPIISNQDTDCGKVENIDLSDIIKLHIKTQTVLPQIMQRVGFERMFGDDQVGGEALVGSIPVTGGGGSSRVPTFQRGKRPSKLVIPPLAHHLPLPTYLEVTTLFDADEALQSSLEGGDALTDSGIANLFPPEFLATPTSAQISKDIIHEPSALVLTPLSRPGSNRTLDEDEADREQAGAWVNMGLDARY
ncbi:hypothetical protein HDU98_011010 [Podochytrium sp. JEL0797]|nr:hypothetical protein HDU98_011010 [Podochytrium sp. JEL0797]